ncbi:beta-N-acetylhexosaminidase [Psychrobacillus psychrodurans]|uniref:beta-N-acetylhexosaminidase n=1 Tax=Psychrobacillus psychrodurans TaxID=126157 RepID=UPI0008E22678|nr:beta-N-acetylhexosaminidase [Psychrobacillus psychrodurans]MCK1997268.1 beta-N-acetylhexosaminidase [Psychrobacillus psychrodurans]MCZ8541257.1 beta-N-acetylhexosaminidase [Psychrobacillus psychrodurans]SFM89190.1 beta-N-acetylhexosaminidase [Psychrobacillus psychrodurans]
MTKKVVILLLILFAIAVVVMLKDSKEDSDSQKEVPIEMSSDAESFVSLLFDLAEKGQTINSPFIVGETTIQKVHELWGAPDRKSKNASAIYEEFLSNDATVGHQSEVVFDIRSSSPEIQQIRLEDIKSIKGEADKVRSYQDDQVDQTIFIYDVTTDFQLKWIMPKPTEEEPNPEVHHISVFTEFEKDFSLSDLSLEEKVGQMIFAGIKGTDITNETKKIISTHQVGGIILFKDNLKNANQSVSLLNAIKQENTNNKVPLFLGVDEEGGRISRLPELTKLPTNEELGKRNDISLSYNIGKLLGKELSAFGFNLDFAPVLDINSNPDNPIIGDRSFGKDAELVSELGLQMMKGIQSEQVISVIKHFPGHGDTAVDSHKELPIIQKSLEELQALELIPFKHAVEQGADVVMVGHILLPKIDSTYPASISERIITDVLREQLGYEGIIITDDMTMKAILNNLEIGESAVSAVKAGNDIVLVAHNYANVKKTVDAILKAIEDGEITEQRIDESVKRILSIKKKYNLSNKQIDGVNIEELNQSINQTLGR